MPLDILRAMGRVETTGSVGAIAGFLHKPRGDEGRRSVFPLDRHHQSALVADNG